MSEYVKTQPYDDVARKWCDLAERRRAHFAELHSSGRWKHYYTEDKFRARMHEVVNAANAWTQLARRPGEHPIAAE
jgi:uncharacterized repeat protein (TIGR03809 family)